MKCCINTRPRKKCIHVANILYKTYDLKNQREKENLANRK